MQYFSDGKVTGWPHIYIKAEYETTREGSKLGIRWKISWSIDQYYFFGYNINADVWTEGNNYGTQIKANSPNRGSGESYFPNENDYYWFDKGYGVNEITGCRIIISSGNGGNISFDTGDDKTVTTPTGYAPSTISSNIDFNIGNDLTLNIYDPTNQNYNYKIYLDLYNESNAWQNIMSLETTSKNPTLSLANLDTTLYSLLPNSQNRPIRINVETYINGTDIGMTTKSGTCYVVNSNPDIPDFVLSSQEYGGIIDSISAGYGPYNMWSNIVACTKNIHTSTKNGATIKKVILDWGDGSPIEELNVGQG